MFAPFTAKEHSGKQLWLQTGQPMLFDNGSKGLTLDRQALNLNQKPPAMTYDGFIDLTATRHAQAVQ